MSTFIEEPWRFDFELNKKKLKKMGLAGIFATLAVVSIADIVNDEDIEVLRVELEITNKELDELEFRLEQELKLLEAKLDVIKELEGAVSE